MKNRTKWFQVCITLMICFLSLMYIVFNADTCYAKESENKPTTYLVKGDTIKLKTDGATINSWRSSNNSVVSVSQKGVIKAKKIGEVTVKAITKNKNYCFKIVVIDTSKIKFSPASKKVVIDTTMYLNPTSDKYSDEEIKEMNLTYRITKHSELEYDNATTLTKRGNFSSFEEGTFVIQGFLHDKPVCSVKIKVIDFEGIKEKNIWMLQNTDTYITLKNIVRAADFRCYQNSGNDINYESTPITKTINGIKYVYKIKIHSLHYPGEFPFYIRVGYDEYEVKIKIGIPPVEAVRTNNYEGYNGEAKKTLLKTREIIDELNLFSKSLSDREKITRLQTYFSNNMEKGNEMNHSPASAIALILLDGTGCCGDYSTTMCFICDIIGIPCYYVMGDVYDEDDWWGHAWNRVKLDGTWYYTDVTYTTCLHSLDEYFLTKTLWNDHRMNEEIYYKDYNPDEEQYLYYSDLY